MNDIVNDKKGHNIMNDSFVHKPEDLIVSRTVKQSLLMLWEWPEMRFGC